MLIVNAINGFFHIYFGLIILRIFLTWIPSINWNQQPVKAIREVTDLYLDFFRRFIPPAGGLDFSPIVAIIVLQILQSVLVSVAASLLM